MLIIVKCINKREAKVHDGLDRHNTMANLEKSLRVDQLTINWNIMMVVELGYIC